MSGIHLITGAPGSGKTLFTIEHVLQLSEETGRMVFYCRIPGVEIEGWTEIESMMIWQQLPENSIIIGDEVWEDWPASNNKEDVPDHITKLRYNRKGGHDLFLISQDPRDINVIIRRIVTRHWHFARVSGLERSRCFVWPKHQSDPDDARARRVTADTWERDFPKEIYPLYKSADVHNIRVTPPKRGLYRMYAFTLVIALSLVLALYSVYVIYGKVIGDDVAIPDLPNNNDKKQLPPVRKGNGFEIGAGAIAQQAPRQVVSSPEKGRDLKKDVKPQLPGLPWTADFYKDIFVAASFPKPYCMLFAQECRCYTQQSTRLNLDDGMCRYFSKFGFFDPTLSSDSLSGNSDLLNNSLSPKSSVIPLPLE